MENNVTVVLRPSEPFQNDEEYEVVVEKAFVMDRSGRNFQGDYFFFRTEGLSCAIHTHAHAHASL